MREYGYHNRTERRRTRSDVRQLTPFVGREEMAILMRRRERARQGEGQLVLIVGEPGLGKSRLIEEFHGRLREAPFRWYIDAAEPLATSFGDRVQGVFCKSCEQLHSTQVCGVSRNRA